MVTLPDKSALGTRTFRPATPGLTVPVSPVGGALANLGGAVQGLGQTFANDAERASLAEYQTKTISFDSDMDTAYEELKRSAPVGAPGFSEQATKTYDEKAQALYDQAPPAVRPWLTQKLAGGRARLISDAQGFQTREADRAEDFRVSGSLEQLQVGIDKDPGRLEELRQQGRDLIATTKWPASKKQEALQKWNEGAVFTAATRDAETRGSDDARSVVTTGEAGQRQGYVFNRLRQKGWSPEAASAIVGGAMVESFHHLDPGAVGDSGASQGIAQWQGPRLTGPNGLQAFARARGVDWRDTDVQVDFLDWELNNTEKAAGDRLRSAGTVEQAAEAFIGFERPAGWTPENPRGGGGWDERYRNARVLAARLGNLPVDVSAEAQTFVNRPEFDGLNVSQRRQVENGYEASFRRSLADIDAREKEMRQTNQAALAPRVDNAVAETEMIGAASDAPTRADFAAAYEPDVAEQKWTQFQGAVETAQAVNTIRTMTPEEQRVVVAAQMPEPGAPDYADQLRQYQVIAQASEQNLKERAADPFGYTMRVDPAVGRAWQRAETPEQVSDAMTFTMQAQQRLGIPEQQRRIIPQSMAKDAVTAWQDEQLPQADRIQGPAKAVFATASAAQRGAVFDQLVDAGLPSESAAVFRAMERGDDGAANRLARAAMVDPGKLPEPKSDMKPAEIDSAIVDQVFGKDTLGDALYGTAAGVAENDGRAMDDYLLAKKAIRLEMASNGGDIDAAIAVVQRDLFGDVALKTDTDMTIAVPTAVDAEAVADGLRAQSGRVWEAVTGLAQAKPLPAPKGLLEPGNVDLANRPRVKNADGSVSTVRSMSFEEDGVEVLVPTVSDDGRIMTDDEAIDAYRKTGRHLGKFSSASDATAYAEALHSQQEQMIGRDDAAAARYGQRLTDLAIDGVATSLIWRNYGDGYAPLDPATGRFLARPDGSVFKVMAEEAVQAAAESRAIRERSRITVEPGRPSNLPDLSR